MYLDEKALKALSSGSRIEILRRLGEKRRTVTELSKELNLTKPTVHEHLSKLLDAGLIMKRDGQHKWVYYELARKGREILHPHETTKIRVLLVSALIAFVGGILYIYRFVEGTLLPGWPELTPQIVHEPTYLIAGLALISIGALLSYLALSVRRRSRGFRSARPNIFANF
jgi:DNA-binding transcriptional ArsR family regulator